MKENLNQLLMALWDLCVTLALIALAGCFVTCIWNWIVVSALDCANAINYWQGIGLFALFKLLFNVVITTEEE